MRKLRVVGGLVALLLAFGTLGEAGAGDFSPKVRFKLSDRRVKANPQMKVHVEQDDGEEELAHVTLRIPKGFKIPADAAIPDGDALGEGEIVINVGPGCQAGSPVPAKGPATLPATLEERDRTDEQADRGVRAVWFLDITTVASITLEITGSRLTGFMLDGDIPANDRTCPALAFDLNVNSQSASGVPIIRNPAGTGYKTFKATFTSQDSAATKTLKQTIRIIR